MKIIKSIKRKLFSTLVKKKALECGKGLKVNHWSQVTGNTILGDNVNFNGMRITGGGNVTIGNNFHSGRACMIIAQNHNYEGEKIPYDNTYIYKDVVIEDNVWIGHRVILLGGAVLGEGCIIQAGSVVSGTIAPCAIAGGHPAQVFKYRDIKHYYDLKEKGLFH